MNGKVAVQVPSSRAVQQTLLGELGNEVMTAVDTSAREVAMLQPSFNVTGVRVDAVTMQEAISRLKWWIGDGRQSEYVAVTGMHGISEALKDPNFREILKQAGLVVPDGMPLVWLARWHTRPLRRRVTGSELMETFCRETGSKYRHFFYGGAPGVAEGLARVLQERYGIVVAGVYAPPFRPLTQNEERELEEAVKAAAPDILWVGLSTPKQERWMHAHRNTLRVPVMLGVGAAFDMNSGKLKRAPLWMQCAGLEWFYRLAVEPRRLWRRYLIAIPSAVCRVILELMHVTEYD
jgi:N-acetylglucosaminyldiphosphoundecaprenol N-acetyl-beta-D-mannosaminyltransferase